MDFTTEVWDPVLLASAQSAHPRHSQTGAGTGPSGGSNNHNSSATAGTGNNQHNSQITQNTAAGSNSNNQQSLPLPSPSPSSSPSSGTPPLAPSLAAQSSSAAAAAAAASSSSKSQQPHVPPTSPSLLPKKNSVIYRIFHLGESAHPDHPDDPNDDPRASVLAHAPQNSTSNAHPAAPSMAFLWGKSRRSYNSGSDADSEDDLSDDSASSAGSALQSSPRHRKPSIVDAVDIFRRSSVTKPKGSNNSGPPSPTGSQPHVHPHLNNHSQSHAHHKKGIFSIGSGDDSSDFDSDIEEESPKKPARSNLFKDLLQGTRTKKSSNASSSRNTSPALFTGDAIDPLSTSREEVLSPFSLDPPDQSPQSTSAGAVQMQQRQESHHNIFKDLLVPRSKRAPSTSSISNVNININGSANTFTSHRRSSSNTALAGSQQPSISIAKLHEDVPSPTLLSPAHAIPPELNQPSSRDLLPHLSHGPPSMERRPSNNSLPRSRSSDISLDEKYGKTNDILGRGAYATVKLCCPLNSKEKYAIKEFRKRRKDETQKEYVKKLIAEFCISSSLDNDNIVRTVDLIQDSKRNWCVVMEYCAGGDLFTRISNGSLKSYAEMTCYFKQLVSGVKYLHSMGVSHRDLKPENLLLDASGRIVKITDFGVSQVFRVPFGTVCKKTRGVAGSGPYIAPEEFDHDEYDSEAVDVWSIGIIYYVMATNSIPWKTAILSDARYKYYLEHLTGFAPIEKLQPEPKRLLYRLLDPDPGTRVKIPDIYEDDWFKSVDSCTIHNVDTVDHQHESHSHK